MGYRVDENKKEKRGFVSPVISMAWGLKTPEKKFLLNLKFVVL